MVRIPYPISTVCLFFSIFFVRSCLSISGNGTEVGSNKTSSNSIVGINHNETEDIALFNNLSATLWDSPAANVVFNTSHSSSSRENSAEVLHPAPSAPRRQLANITPSPLTEANPPPPPPPPPRPGRKKLTRLQIALSTWALAGLLVLVSFFIYRLIAARRRTEADYNSIQQVPGMPVRFSYRDLCLATENFRERLGGGGFGSVFKGVLPDGTEIAVKRLDKVGQGMREFVAEVETIGSLHHFNLVRLIGFCAENSYSLLVYEYMSNGSLDKWIFDNNRRSNLDWQTRKKIILDIAKGLAYLHEDCRHKIIHLDIKPQNILLDQNFNAKVSDFGLSKLINRDESQVQIPVRGTPGYLAPEWRQLRITVKVDIYSFGVVLLEVITARHNLDYSRSESTLNLLKLLEEKAEQNRLMDIAENFEENLQEHKEEALRMIRIGAWCLQDNPNRRPPMSTVVKILEGVMEVDPNIVYKFPNALTFPPVVSDGTSSAPLASILSHPR